MTSDNYYVTIKIVNYYITIMNIQIPQPTVIEMLEKDLEKERAVMERLIEGEISRAIQNAYINGIQYALDVIKLNQ